MLRNELPQSEHGALIVNRPVSADGSRLQPVRLCARRVRRCQVREPICHGAAHERVTIRILRVTRNEHQCHGKRRGPFGAYVCTDTMVPAGDFEFGVPTALGRKLRL